MIISRIKHGVLAASIFLAACAQQPIYKPIEVSVPITTPCVTDEIPQPSWPMQNVTRHDSLFTKTQAALAELNLRQGYEAQLNAALDACR